jgi:hypothetical protein
MLTLIFVTVCCYKSKEQLEAEKRAILGQRRPIQALNINGFDAGQLKEKAKELHALLSRLESEKYDLEKCFKGQQFDVSYGKEMVILIMLI